MHFKSFSLVLALVVVGWLATVSPSAAGLVNEIYGTLNPYDAGLEPYRSHPVEYGDIADGFTLRFTVNHNATFVRGSGSPRYRHAFTNATLEDSAGRVYTFNRGDWVQAPVYYIEFVGEYAGFVPHFTFYYEDYSRPGTFGDFDFLDRIGDNVAAGVGFGYGLTIDYNYTIVDGWYAGGTVTGGKTIQPVPASGSLLLVVLGGAMMLVMRHRERVGLVSLFLCTDYSGKAKALTLSRTAALTAV